MSRQRRTFTPEFKLQLVKLYKNGKSHAYIAREYVITSSALDRRIKKLRETRLFVAKDNRTEEEFVNSLAIVLVQVRVQSLSIRPYQALKENCTTFKCFI